jgi:hypothetical protein
MSRIRLASALALALACTSPSPADAPKSAPEVPEVSTANPIVEPIPKPVPAEDGFFMAEGAPSPRACGVAADCLGDTIPDLGNPCCQDPRSLEPYAWAYRNWLNGWRTEHCESVTCPPPPPPSEPPACAFDVDCVAGRCLDACD